MVIPNLLTFSRLLAPFFILPATLFGSFPIACTFAFSFALTDAFDGYLARKWNATSDFGKNLDPICDKFFILGVIIPFITNPLMISTITLEAAIALINLNSAFKNNNPKSTYIGKSKTVLLSALITLSYLFKSLNLSLNLLLPLVILTNTTQAITAINYMHIDNKKDIIKDVEQIVKKDIESDNLNKEISKTKQELIEYRHLKESLTTKEQKESEKKRHFTL
jgi:phosphatidylglycerophosphate synthase